MNMEVKIYTTPSCAWCQKLKEWLKKKKIGYQEMDVTESDNYREEMVEKSNQMAVPAIDLGGEIVVGFDEKRLEEIFKKKKGK
jgi:glutaredoxin-like YruB-family protein